MNPRQSGRFRFRAFAVITASAVLIAMAAHTCRADSAISLLGGFDEARIETVYPPSSDEATGELSKLVYRLGKLDPLVLEAKVGDGAALGDAVRIDGIIGNITPIDVPEPLIEFLEFDRLWAIDVRVADKTLPVVTSTFPEDAASGDRVSGYGVVIETSAGPQPAAIAIAAPRLSWFPKSSRNDGWKLLSGAGMDVSLLAEVATRHRKPLMPADADAFYTMLAAADAVGQRPTAPAPQRVQSVTLLKDTSELSGQWLRIDLETVQVTRIAVTEPYRQQQLGSDHYFQIDAVGDLGNVVVMIERPAGDEGKAATFETRYPISVVVSELPDFLRTRIRQQEGGDAIVAEIKVMVQVDGFFFRLWSYTTDYMKQYGGGDQFGPLVVAARIDSLEPTSNDAVGVGIIGWIAAIAVFAGILATWLWNRRLAARDDDVRRKRKARESEQLQLPTP